MDQEKSRLLLVDGSTQYLMQMGMTLRKLNFTVQSLKSAEDAMKTMESEAPALVLTDTLLPRMSGIDMLKQMRQHPALQITPVIIHTSEEDQSVEQACVQEGCVAYFRKPAELNALYRAIQSAINAAPRQHVRIDTFLPVEIGDCPIIADGLVKAGRVTTLSESGLFIKTQSLEPVHSIVTLRLSVGDRIITVKAEVLYNSTNLDGQKQIPGMGLKFVDLSKQDLTFLRTYITQQLSTDLIPEIGAVRRPAFL